MPPNNVMPLHSNRKPLTRANFDYVSGMRTKGDKTLQQICNDLNDEGFTTSNGALLHPVTVAAFIDSGGTRFFYTVDERKERQNTKSAQRLADGKPPVQHRQPKEMKYSAKTVKAIKKTQYAVSKPRKIKEITFRNKIQQLLDMEKDDKVCKRLIAALVES